MCFCQLRSEETVMPRSLKYWTLSTVLGGEPQLHDRGWGESLAKGPKIISLVFEKFICMLFKSVHCCNCWKEVCIVLIRKYYADRHKISTLCQEHTEYPDANCNMVTSQQIQDGGRPPYWKSFMAISQRFSARFKRNLVQRSWNKLRHMSRDQNTIFQKSKKADSRHFENDVIIIYQPTIICFVGLDVISLSMSMENAGCSWPSYIIRVYIWQERRSLVNQPNIGWWWKAHL